MRTFVHYPLLIVIVCLPLCFAMAPQWRLYRKPIEKWLWPAVFIMLFAGIIGPVFSAAGHMIYHDEPTLIAVAAAELHGQPLYHGSNDGQRYSLLYGPVAYWVYQPLMLAGFTDLRVYQVWVIIPLLFAGLTMVRVVRRAGDMVGWGFALLPYAVTVLMQSANEWAMKGDAWMLLFFTLELSAALLLPSEVAIFVVPITAMLLVHIKVTAIVLACVPVTLLRVRFGLGKALLSGLLLICLLPLPFLVPGVRAQNFLYWIRASTHHGFDPHLAFRNAVLVLFMALPAISLIQSYLRGWNEALAMFRKYRAFLLCLVAASVVAVVTGAKVGAGPWHCAPLAPLFAWITATLWSNRRFALRVDRRSRAYISAVVIAQFIAGVLSFGSGFISHWRGNPATPSPPGRLVAQDLISIHRMYPDTQIQMGYGGDSTYEMTWQRPVLVLLGNSYELDADQMNEAGFAHLPLPRATLEELRSCRSPLYLIPKGDPPFSMRSLYHAAGYNAPESLFPNTFREEFLHDYQKAESSQYFDVWRCATQLTGPPSTPQ